MIVIRDVLHAQEQLASSPAAGAAAAGGEGGAALSSAAAVAAAGELPAVGSSGRRPLHVVITGVPPGALQVRRRWRRRVRGYRPGGGVVDTSPN